MESAKSTLSLLVRKPGFWWVLVAFAACGSAAALSEVMVLQHGSVAAAQFRDLSGIWTADDGANYYIRQVGDQVWWTGLSDGNGRSFTNVFHGSIQRNVIEGGWSDVPRGKMLSSGSLTLVITTTNNGMELRRQNETGGFEGTVWRQWYSTTSGQPPERSSSPFVISYQLRTGSQWRATAYSVSR